MGFGPDSATVFSSHRPPSCIEDLQVFRRLTSAVTSLCSVWELSAAQFFSRTFELRSALACDGPLAQSLLNFRTTKAVGKQ